MGYYDDMKYFNIFLDSIGEEYIEHKQLSGGNDNRIYQLNNKYFFKVKDYNSIFGESIYNKYYYGKYHPKCYYVDKEYRFIVYEMLDANDIEDTSKINNLIDIAYEEVLGIVDVTIKKAQSWSMDGELKEE